MTNRIDDLNTSYLIPGAAFGAPNIEEAEDIEKDYSDAPYSQMPAVEDVPSSDAWRELLGLNTKPALPSQITPPPRPQGLRGSDSGLSGISLQNLKTSLGAANGATPPPQVKRMMDLLTAQEEAMGEMRMRSFGGGM